MREGVYVQYAVEISLYALKKLECGGVKLSDDELLCIIQKCEKLDVTYKV